MRRTPHVVGPGLPRVLAGLVAASGAALPTPPADVTLEFAAPPQPLGTQVRVTGLDGTPAPMGEPDVRGATVVQPLAEALPAGSYTVEWRLTSADGHPISGTFSFAATGGAPPVAAGAGGLPSAGADPAGTTFPSVWIAVGVVVAVGGALVMRQLRRTA